MAVQSTSPAAMLSPYASDALTPLQRLAQGIYQPQGHPKLEVAPGSDKPMWPKSTSIQVPADANVWPGNDDGSSNNVATAGYAPGVGSIEGANSASGDYMGARAATASAGSIAKAATSGTPSVPSASPLQSPQAEAGSAPPTPNAPGQGPAPGQGLDWLRQLIMRFAGQPPTGVTNNPTGSMGH